MPHLIAGIRVRLDPERLQRLTAMAHCAEVSRGALIRRMIDHASVESPPTLFSTVNGEKQQGIRAATDGTDALVDSPPVA